MKISAERQILCNEQGRVCEVSARGGSFTLREATIEPQSLNDEPSLDLKDIESDLAQVGFYSASSQLEISNAILDDNKPYPESFSSDTNISPLFAEINIDIEKDETLVAIELNPATGEIIDWHQAEARIEPLPMTPSPTKVLMKDSSTTRQQALFKIPLNTHYSPEFEAYEAENFFSFKPKKLFKKIIKVFAIKKLKRLAKKAVGKILTGPIRLLDKHFVKAEKFGRLNQDGSIRKLTDSGKKALSGQNALLFVHGIISSSSGAFGDLLADEDSFGELNNMYDSNLLAYNHWTLSKDVFQNAKAIASALPKETNIDIICHSRGGAVVRSLLELPNIQESLKKKSITVRNVIFVAGACEGSDLATGNALDNLFRVFSKMGSLLGKPAFGAIVVSKVIKLVLGGLQELPGTDSVNPKGKYIDKLNSSESTIAEHYMYFRANYDPKNIAVAALDKLIIDKAIFANKANDVVVPFAGAGISKGYLDGKVNKTLVAQYGTARQPESIVWHTTFFSNSDMRKKLIKALK